MRCLILFSSSLAVLIGIATSSAEAGFAEDQKACNTSTRGLTITEVDEKIAACTRQILSGKWKGANLAISYSNRGRHFHNKADLDRAIADYNEAIRISPKYAVAYSNRGEAWRDKGDLDRALADHNQAISLNPKYSGAYNNRALLWKDKGDFDRALMDYDTAIRLDPKEALAYANRGEAWRLKGDLIRSIADLDTALKYNSKGPLVYTQRGDTWRYKGEIDRAIADFNEALRQYPEFVAAYVGRGLAYEKKGELAAARADFEKALTLPGLRDVSTATPAFDTARARLAAFNSGAPQPAIPAAPAIANAASIPTPTVAAPVVASVPAANQGRRVALVIGNSAYRTVAELQNPRRDAKAVSATLRATGFDTVTLLNDATREISRRCAASIR